MTFPAHAAIHLAQATASTARVGLRTALLLAAFVALLGGFVADVASAPQAQRRFAPPAAASAATATAPAAVPCRT